MFRITKSSGTYYEDHPVSIGILVRGDLAESWDLVEGMKTACPDMPVLLCCITGAGDASRSELHRFRSAALIESHTPISPGEGVNEIMSRSTSEKTVIIWSDMTDVSDSLCNDPPHEDALCVTPLLKDSSEKYLPRVMVPYYAGTYLRFAALEEGRHSVMPYDYVGCYDTPMFNALQGYCSSFTNPFWQILDFGCRAFLWGHSIVQDDLLQISYRRKAPVYDQSKDEDYIRWYRRNCTVVRKRGVLMRKRVFLHQRAAEEQVWLKQNMHRFMRSMEEVINGWERG